MALNSSVILHFKNKIFGKDIQQCSKVFLIFLNNVNVAWLSYAYGTSVSRKKITIHF